MTKVATRDVSILSEFEDFYWEVIRLRTRAEVQFEAAEVPDGDAPMADPAETIWKAMEDLLERQERFTTTSAGDIGYRIYREAQYVMAALADETFLNARWSGSEYWTNHLLESRFFNSNIAGEEVFRRIDKLLLETERGHSESYTIYLMALSLGFRGKYRDRDDGGRIDKMRRSLFLRVYHRKPQLSGAGRRLFASCYNHTLDLGKAKNLPSPKRWFWALAAAVALWIGVSTLVWYRLTDGLEDCLAKIQTHEAQSASRTSTTCVQAP